MFLQEGGQIWAANLFLALQQELQTWHTTFKLYSIVLERVEGFVLRQKRQPVLSLNKKKQEV